MDASGRTTSAHDDAQLALLRELVAGHLASDLAALRAEIVRVDARFGDPAKLTALVGDILPGALARAQEARNRSELNAAMGLPWIGGARVAAEQRLEAATDALAPMLLPAIAQAVKERLNAFTLALRRASPTRRIAWKIKSLQSGLPLETVIEQDLDPFQVHRVLAVEMPGGNLLASHRVPDGGDSQATAAEADEEAFTTAALLTALRGFVRDAGIGEQAAELNSIDVGKRTLHLAQQGSMLVAVEASGQLAHDLETSLHSELFPALRSAKNQKEREHALATWRSDVRRGARDTGVSALWLLGAIALAVLAGIWFARDWIEKRDVAATRSRIEAVPGVAAVSAMRSDNGWFLNIAADPTAEIEGAFAPMLTSRERVAWRVDPILSLDPTIVAKALAASLPPPQGVRLVVRHPKIIVEGEIAQSYLDALRLHPRVAVAGISVELGTTATVRAQ